MQNLAAVTQWRLAGRPLTVMLSSTEPRRLHHMKAITEFLRCVRTGPGRDDFRLELKTPLHSVDTADARAVRLDSRGPAIAGLGTRSRDTLLSADPVGK